MCQLARSAASFSWHANNRRQKKRGHQMLCPLWQNAKADDVMCLIDTCQHTIMRHDSRVASQFVPSSRRLNPASWRAAFTRQGDAHLGIDTTDIWRLWFLRAELLHPRPSHESPYETNASLFQTFKPGKIKSFIIRGERLSGENVFS